MKYDRVGVSKIVGWDGPIMPIPPRDEIEQLYRKAKNGDCGAAVELFRYYRFCSNPATEDERGCVDRLSEIFRDLYE